jgi:capsular polysaccharide biosynthesis protein
VNTFVSIAESRSTLAGTAGVLGMPADRVTSHTPAVTVRPSSFVLDISVEGPDRKAVVALVNRLSQEVAGTVTADFPIVAVSALDAASTSVEIQPRPSRNDLRRVRRTARPPEAEAPPGSIAPPAPGNR